MHLLAAFSLRNRALIALVTIVAAFFGVVATGSLKQELIPSVQFPQLAVVSTYTGASPQIVSDRVSKPLEQAIRGIAGVESTSSRSSTGSSTVSVSFTYGTNLDAAEQKIGSAVNRIRTTLPDGVDPQVIAGSIDDLPILSVAVLADASTQVTAASVRQSVVPELEKLDGVRAASVSGAPGSRITIVPRTALKDHGLTDTVLSSTLSASGVLEPGGTLTEGGSTRALQIGSELGSTADIRALPLTGVTQQQWNASGSGDLTRPPQIGDAATVTETTDPVTTVSLVDGRPALTISITKLPAANTVDVSKAVRAALPGLRDVLGQGGRFSIVFDQAPYIEQSIESLFSEGLLGLLFAVIVILVFLLSIRGMLITAISIPTSVLITLIGMQAAQYSLNILTLGAITIAIGRVVDDSIVVTENIARHYREDFPGFANDREDRRRIPADDRRRSVFAAVREVAGAVTASTVTTVAVFLPIALLGQTAGELFRPFAFTVAIALVASLFVALTIVPVLAYWFLRPGRSRRESAKRLTPLQRGYRPILSTTLAHPWLTILAAVLVLGGTIALVPHLQTNYLGSTGQNTLTVTQTVADGTSLDAQTVRARAVDRTLRATDGVRTVATSIGSSGSSLRDAFGGGSGTRITYSVTTAAGADQTALQNRIRTRLGGSVGEFSIAASQGPGTSSDIEVDITAGNSAALNTATQRVLDRVRTLPQIAETSSDLSASQRYVAVDIDARKAAKAGYSEAALAQLVARQTQPSQIGSITVGDSALTVYLQQRDPPTTVAKLQQLSIPVLSSSSAAGSATSGAAASRGAAAGAGAAGSAAGAAAAAVPTPTPAPKHLKDLAVVRQATEPAAVTSTDGNRSSTVTATPAGQDTGAATAAVTKAVAAAKLPAGAVATLGGVASDQSSAFGQLGLAFLAAILIVYTVMVATFRSLLQPLLLLVSVPFATTGAILLQLASGIPLGVASLIGVVMLVGIVVTNAIVLIDLVNQYRERGESVRDAVLDGASRRLRPILMTALATIFALVPLAIGVSGQGGFISQPLAIVVIGGLVSSTVLTLVVLPTLYYLVEGRRERRDARRARRAANQRTKPAPPAKREPVRSGARPA